MPSLSQRMVRTALVWVAFGATLGGLVLFEKGVPVAPWLWMFRSAHIHTMLIGWVIQLACGVAFWILPRLDTQGSRGNEQLVLFAYIALNIGVVLGVLAGPLAALGTALAWPLLNSVATVLPALIALCYALGAGCFAAHAWPRVVPFRTLSRGE